MVYAVANATDAKATKTVVVAVIDTGISDSLIDKNMMCKHGSKDFTGTGLQDRHGHGTHVSTLIDQYVKGIYPGREPKTFQARLASVHPNYCQVILKFVDDPYGHEVATTFKVVKAINYAVDIHVDVINFSGGGESPLYEEKRAILRALNSGIKVIVAAGNNSKRLVKGDSYYPAAYDPRIIVVGNLAPNLKDIVDSSNYGDIVKFWEVGYEVPSLCLNNEICEKTGSSQSTAIKSGKVIREMLSHQ